MHYINQLAYRHIPYHTNTKNDTVLERNKIRNVALSGCGLCCVCMMIELLTDTTLDIEDCVKISEECAANHSRGTDMTVLAPVIANKFGLNYSGTSELEEAIHHLQGGGHIIAHVGVPEGKEIGLFTKGGHYISLISTDGEDFCILDPSYTVNKFDIPERVGRVDTSHAPYLYCNAKLVDSETKVGKTKYHLFSRKK